MALDPRLANVELLALAALRVKPCHDRLCWLTLCGTSSQPTFFL